MNLEYLVRKYYRSAACACGSFLRHGLLFSIAHGELRCRKYHRGDFRELYHAFTVSSPNCYVQMRDYPFNQRTQVDCRSTLYRSSS